MRIVGFTQIIPQLPIDSRLKNMENEKILGHQYSIANSLQPIA